VVGKVFLFLDLEWCFLAEIQEMVKITSNANKMVFIINFIYLYLILKTILLALLVILTISCISARKHHSKSKNKKTLPTTPKAITLSNHYGTGKGRDIY
jgi:hypothetical protein